MPGPFGYDKGYSGLRSPNEIDPIYKKTGPIIGLKCTGNPGYDNTSCWYCIVNRYTIIGDTIIEYSAGCDWYRDGTTDDEGRIKPKNKEFLSKCPLYSHTCL
jgi:hypothetical protein